MKTYDVEIHAVFHLTVKADDPDDAAFHAMELIHNDAADEHQAKVTYRGKEVGRLTV